MSKNAYLKTLTIGNLNAIYSMWPYVAVSGMNNTIYLICAFDNNVLKRIVFPLNSNETRVSEMFITVENDLFI